MTETKRAVAGARLPAPTADTSRGTALQWARQQLAQYEARYLLGHVLQCSSAQLIAWPERSLSAQQAAAFVALVERRQAGEPLAYLTGFCEFYGRQFAVSPAVLIPRHDTELIVELALARLAPTQPAQVLDLGCGSGVIAVTLALERPQAKVTAVDVSAPALAVARHNAAQLQAAIGFGEGSWFAGLSGPQAVARFDLIVSNPPYIATADPHLAQGDLRFEPAGALAAGEDGLADLRQIISTAPAFLLPGGWLLLEHGYEQGAAVRALLVAAGFEAVASWRDLAGHERVSGGRRGLPGSIAGTDSAAGN